MSANLFFDRIRVFSIVANDILEVEKIFRFDGSKVEADFTIAGPNGFSRHHNSLGHSGQKNGKSAHTVHRDIFGNFQQTTAYAEISNSIDRVIVPGNREFCAYIKKNPVNKNKAARY